MASKEGGGQEPLSTCALLSTDSDPEGPGCILRSTGKPEAGRRGRRARSWRLQGKVGPALPPGVGAGNRVGGLQRELAAQAGEAPSLSCGLSMGLGRWGAFRRGVSHRELGSQAGGQGSGATAQLPPHPS